MWSFWWVVLDGYYMLPTLSTKACGLPTFDKRYWIQLLAMHHRIVRYALFVPACASVFASQQYYSLPFPFSHSVGVRWELRTACNETLSCIHGGSWIALHVSDFSPSLRSLERRCPGSVYSWVPLAFYSFKTPAARSNLCLLSLSSIWSLFPTLN